MVFRRYFGLLDRNGKIVDSAKQLLDFGLSPARFRRRGLSGGVHGNTYVIRKALFEKMGGYNPKHCESGFHVGGSYMSEERDFNRRFYRLNTTGEAEEEVMGPNIYVFPTSKFHRTGDNNPGGLFHSLSLEQVPQPLKE